MSTIRNTQNYVYLTMAQLLAYHRHFLVEDSWPTLPSHSNIYDALAPNVETLFQLRPVLELLFVHGCFLTHCF